ncbi:transcriptional regulator [Kitasatospora sp. RB6PN24]|uniref:winged helix-turn-helix domain-containing protein n=1 Tax=Kitasatospora humi TaxID=2893891 RepID=UPI001E4249BC|nr:transcriptional regulator [Kitasatospora humi]MCC9309627.1 transcriptional regulator [Kitasatospora humi]
MSGVDEVIHHPTRLALVGFLSGCHEAEFGAVRDYCGISDASVSRIVSALEEAGYVKVRKGYVGKRPRTWLALTQAGRTALADHLAALRSIVDNAARAAGRPPQP